MNGMGLARLGVGLVAVACLGQGVLGDESESSGAVRFYPTGTEPPPFKQKHVKPEKLNSSPHVSRMNLFHYSIQLAVDSETRVDQKSKGGDGVGWRTQAESGDTRYVPRISVCARNSELPKGCLLVIEYFSKTPTSKSMSQRECVEHIRLPGIAKGQTLTLDAEGVEFYKYEYKSGSDLSYKYENRGGLELYGLICSLFQDEKLLIQVCTPPPLAQECSESISEPMEQKRSQSRYYFM